jgi:hypothetical protein
MNKAIVLICLLGLSICGDAPQVFQFDGCEIDEEDFWDPNSWDVTGLEYFQKSFFNLSPFADIMPIDVVIGKSSVVILGGDTSPPVDPTTGEATMNEGAAGDGNLGNGSSPADGFSNSSLSGNSTIVGENSTIPQDGSISDGITQPGDSHTATLPNGDISVTLPEGAGDSVSVTPGDGAANIILNNNDTETNNDTLGSGQDGYYDDNGVFHPSTRNNTSTTSSEDNIDSRSLSEVVEENNTPTTQPDTPTPSTINNNVSGETNSPSDITNVNNIHDNEPQPDSSTNSSPSTPPPITFPTDAPAQPTQPETSPVVSQPDPVVTPPVIITPIHTPVNNSTNTTDHNLTLDKNNPGAAGFLNDDKNKTVSSSFYTLSHLMILLFSIIFI